MNEKLILDEGTHYDDEAVKILDTANIYSHEINQKIINLLYRGDEQNEPDIHAFVHAPNWLMKYLKGIARMLVQYANKSQDKAKEFLEQAPSIFEPLLTWIKINRTEKNAAELDDNFVNKWSFEDTKDFLNKIQTEEEKQSADKLKNIKSTSSSYDLIPIDSYNQFHKLFGGKWTGDGGSVKGAGSGGTAWCHANGRGTYDGWVEKGRYKFFVLAKKDWKDIPAVKGDNCPKDEYGLSLMALRVKTLDGSLMNCTLRWNHINVPSNADNQFTNYGDLSQVVGFNVKEQINEKLKDAQSSLQKESESANETANNLLQGLKVIGKETISEKIKNKISSIVIPNSVKEISDYAFSYCSSLTSVVIPNSVKEIGNYVFEYCKSLTSIVIPNSVKEIGVGAFENCTTLTSVNIPNSVEKIDMSVFYGCSSLTSIVIPNSVKEIDNYAFSYCYSLTSVVILNSTEKIDSYAFSYCSSLTSVVIPNSVKEIGANVFYGCSSLTSIVIPNSVKEIGGDVFYGCSSLTSIVIPDSVKEIGDWAFGDCSSLKTIYCEAESQPISWDDEWNDGCNAKVVWGYKGKTNESYITEVYPHKGENKQDFINRFMKATKKEYDNPKQRLAVAYSYWNKKESLNMTKDKKIEEKYTPDNFIDKVFEDNTNASYDETIQAMAKAIDEIKYDEDTIEDDLISEAASRIASAYGTDVVSAYDDLINAQDEKYANHSYPSADDLEGTYGGPLDEDNQKSNTSLLADLEINLFDINTSKSKDPEENYSISVNEGSFGHSLEANFLEAKEFASEYGLRVYALKDYDISDEDKLELAHVIYAGKAKNILKYLHDNFNAGEDVKWAKENKIDYKPVDETLEKTDNKFNDFGKTWSVFKIHMHGSEPEQEVAKGLSSREAADKVTSLRAVEKDKDISYVSHSVEHSKFIKDHQKFVNNKDSEDDLQEDYHDRQKSIRCLKDLGKNYNFDRFSDQQLYVMCKKAQREAQQLAQERAEMEDELENCPEAQTCPQCGGPLNDAGECPKCDLGDEDESLKEDERKINSQSEKETSFEDINVGDGFDEISFWDENSVLGHVGDDAVMRAVLHLAKKYYIYNHDKIKGYGADDALVNAYEHIDNNGVWFDPTVEEDNQLKDALKDWIDYPETPAPDFKDEEAEFSKSLDAACKQYKLFDFISDKVNDKNTAKEMCLAFLGVIDDDQHLSDTSTREHLANLMEDNMNDQGAIDACNSYTLFDYIAENYYSMSLEDLKELAKTFLDAIDDWMTLNSEYTMQTIRDEFVNRDLITESSR